ncbi:phage portal protein [Pseudomonas sp. MSSRFD41]|nr:phage portal protein [Pseudomonas sp. MSSRFD41]
MIFRAAFESRSSPESPSTPMNSKALAEWVGLGNSIAVSPASALKLTAVYACIYVLSSTMGQLPLSVLRKVGGRIEPGTDHPAHYLLHDEPNQWQTSYRWRETKQAHALGWGNGFTRIVRSRRGELQTLDMCEPWVTDLVKNGSRWVYSTQDEDGQPLAVAPEDMIHLRAIGSKRRMGTSPIQQNAETVGLGMAAVRYGKEFFEGGGRPTGIVSVKDGKLGNDAWERLKRVWRDAAGALKRSDNKTLLMPAELDYKALTIAPEDAQFLETRKLTRSEIASMFNVPSHMINDLEKATFSNISEQAIQFVRHSVMPWIKNWEEEINRRVFTRAERLAGYYVKFNLAGLLRGTPKERAEFYRIAIQDGWMSRNEVRVLEDLNPLTGLDQMLLNVNTQLLGADGMPLPVTPKE